MANQPEQRPQRVRKPTIRYGEEVLEKGADWDIHIASQPVDLGKLYLEIGENIYTLGEPVEERREGIFSGVKAIRDAEEVSLLAPVELPLGNDDTHVVYSVVPSNELPGWVDESDLFVVYDHPRPRTWDPQLTRVQMTGPLPGDVGRSRKSRGGTILGKMHY